MYFMIGKHFKHCNLQNLKFLTFSIAAILKNLQEAWRPFRTADTKVNVLSKKPLLCTLQYTYLMIHNITFSEEKIAKNYNWPFKTVETPSK